MKTLRSRVAAHCFVILGFLLLGCSSSQNRTHRADLLDDKVTAQRLQAAFKEAGGELAGVQAGVTNGVIILTGSVSSPELRARAEEVARSVHRGTKLKDEVQVRPPGRASGGTASDQP